jgi:hypothetical protein
LVEENALVTRSNKTTTTEPARIFGNFRRPIIDDGIISVKPSANIMYLISKEGIKTNTVRNVPIMLPMVAAMHFDIPGGEIYY